MTNREIERQLRAGFADPGDIGEPVARRVVDTGFPTTPRARREASPKPFRGTAPWAGTPAGVGRDSDVAKIRVFDERDVGEVGEVVLGEDGIPRGMAPDGVVLVHSTVPVDHVADLRRRCAPRDVTVPDGAIKGTFTRPRNETRESRRAG
ncbi:hypothetical protein [Streptosporangium sp. NPDC002721]|uniref:hypothetical protein n=1 Tax=Streptosporangium sp. NPDC002721 TaxID=3366188 RepID=UPI0036A6AF56